MPVCKASRVSRYTLCCSVGQIVAQTNTVSRVELEELVHALQEAKRQDWTGLNVPGVSGSSAKAGAKGGGASSAQQAGGAVAGKAQGAGAAAQRAGGQAGDVAQQAGSQAGSAAQQAGSQAGSQVRQMSQQVLRFHCSS